LKYNVIGVVVAESNRDEHCRAFKSKAQKMHR
jgi:hypothetical protein